MQIVRGQSTGKKQRTYEVLVLATGVFVWMADADNEHTSADEAYFRQAPTSALEIWLG